MMKKFSMSFLCCCFLFVFLGGCVHVHINKEQPNVEESIAENALKSDPLKFNTDGAYSAVFHYSPGGLKEMNLKTAYVAFYPKGLTDQMNQITDGEYGSSEPPLPADVQDQLSAVEGTDKLKKIAVIVWELIDDTTVKVDFKDPDLLAKDNTYYFVIPDENLAGSVTAEES